MAIRQKVTKVTDILTFGKYKGKNIDFVLGEEPSYLLWLDENEIVEFSDDIYNLAEKHDRDNNPLDSSWGWDGYEDD